MTQSGQQRRCPHAGPWHHGATAPCTSQAAAAAAVPAQAGTQAPPARDSILCCPAPATTVVADPRQPLSPPSRAGHSCRRRRLAPDTAASPPRTHPLHRSAQAPDPDRTGPDLWPQATAAAGDANAGEHSPGTGWPHPPRPTEPGEVAAPPPSFDASWDTQRPLGQRRDGEE
jgi:hypothetical protein